jgi:hypothetical protein
MQKAMCGLLRSALLFYKTFVADMEGAGFKLNPYNTCVAIKTVNGTHMTVCSWRVDDLKVSHIDPNQVTKFGAWLSKVYGVAVAEHRGKVHDYLGMMFNFLEKGKVSINMIKYIKNIIADFLEEINVKRFLIKFKFFRYKYIQGQTIFCLSFLPCRQSNRTREPY